MISNDALIWFFQNNWIFVLLFLISLIKAIPHKWLKSEEFVKASKESRVTLLTFVLESFFDSLSRASFSLLAVLGLQATVTLIIFVVVIFDIVVKREISTQAVSLFGIGIVALYLNRLIETGKKISFFGMVAWERKDEPTVLPYHS
ncbi:MAG: hypothetical protein WC840_00135 [Candidatus Peribacteraceae bacterium]